MHDIEKDVLKTIKKCFSKSNKKNVVVEKPQDLPPLRNNSKSPQKKFKTEEDENNSPMTIKQNNYNPYLEDEK